MNLRPAGRAVLTIVLFVIIVGLLGLAYLRAGYYDVAATSPHTDLAREILEMTTDASIEHNAEGVVVPDTYDSTLYLRGFPHFNDMCIDCHGGPGIGRTEFGQGLYPLAPALNEKGGIGWSPAQTFWIVKHGIKMTGMPAFAPTHSDEEIWNIVAFVKKLPAISYYDYLHLQDSLSSEMHEHEH